MDLEIVKRAICDAIPNNVSISNVDIQEGNAELSIKISWKVIKESSPINLPFPDMGFEVSDPTHWWLKDGYSYPNIPIIDFNQRIPIEKLDLPEAYRAKIKAEFEKSVQETNKLHKAKKEAGKILAVVDKLRTGSKEEVEDANILEELAWKVADPSNLEELASKVKASTREASGEIYKVRKVKNSEGTVVRTIKVPIDQEVAVKGTYQYINALVRAGITPEVAQEMAKDRTRCPTSIPVYVKPPKTTIEGKVVTSIDLPTEPTVREQHQKAAQEMVDAKYRDKKSPGFFRRAEPDGYTTVVVDGKAKVIDGYHRPRNVKNAFEVVAEYKKAVEAYDKRFANVRSPLAPKPNAADKGKRAVPALTAHSLPFSHRDRKVTDVEVMFMANEKMAKLTDPPSLMDDLKVIEAKLPPQTKFKRILFHLKSIKNEILRKTNG